VSKRNRSRDNQSNSKSDQTQATQPYHSGNSDSTPISTSPVTNGQHGGANTNSNNEEENASTRFRDPNTYIALGTIVLAIIGIIALCISRNTEIQQLSAFVTVNNLHREDILDEHNNIVQIRFSPVIENSGQTAVKRGKYRIGYDEWHGSDNLSSPTGPTNRKWVTPVEGAKISLGPRSEQTSVLSSVGIDKEIINQLKNRTAVLYVFGEVKYTDVFGYCHMTNFCFTVGRKNKSPVSDEIPIHFCEGDANCTDDECSDYHPC
jgi:hypothetical protein